MKKKFISIILTAVMVASLTTACGGKKEASAPAPQTRTETSAPAAEAKTETPAPAAETKTETSAPAEETKTEADSEIVTVDDGDADSSADGEFTLLDVTTDMVTAGVYAINEEGTELVVTLFTEPSGTPMASMFMFASDGSGDVICGPFTGESETDEDGITWSVMNVSDVYTDEEFEIGFGETESGEVYILNAAGEIYEGQYLTADETIVYMGTAAALLEE